MSNLYISEYPDAGYATSGSSVPAEPSFDQVVAFTGTPGASAAFKNNTKFVRIHTDGIASILFGTAPTAAITNKRLTAGQTEYYVVPVGAQYKISAITNT